ncbi:MAG: Smr/MutS family protein [Acidobacteriota bacterium]
MTEGENPFPEPVALPVDGVLDLHPFPPREVPAVVEAYLAECRRLGILDVKIIHGKGTGTLRRTVLALLARLPGVAGVSPAGSGDGGWGATFVVLRPLGNGEGEPGR